MKLHPGQRSVIEAFVRSLYVGHAGSYFPWSSDSAKALEAALVEGDFWAQDIWAIVHKILPHWFVMADEVPTDPEERELWDRHIIHEFVSKLEGLPRRYEVFVYLGQASTDHDFIVSLGPGIHLLSVDKHLTGAPLVPDKGGLLLGHHQSKLACLRVTDDGYAESGLETALWHRVISKLKICTFLLEHYGLMVSVFPFQSAFARAEVLEVSPGESSGEFFSHALPESISSTTGNLSFSNNAFSGGTNLPKPDQLKAASRCVNFFAKSASPDYSRLVAAIEWHVDSTSSSDQTVGYLAACIGLESLFGEVGSELQTVRLADRYAYLFGGSRQERAQRYDHFTDAFKVRGNLVHARQSRLNASHRDQLQKIQRMLHASIVRELELFGC